VNAAAFSHYFTKSLLGLGPILFGAAVLAALYAGWHYREEEYITADTGIGYWLGIFFMTISLLLHL
jgi:hypothetical protein